MYFSVCVCVCGQAVLTLFCRLTKWTHKHWPSFLIKSFLYPTKEELTENDVTYRYHVARLTDILMNLYLIKSILQRDFNLNQLRLCFEGKLHISFVPQLLRVETLAPTLWHIYSNYLNKKFSLPAFKGILWAIEGFLISVNGQCFISTALCRNSY